jgi:hypothetical protein
VLGSAGFANPAGAGEELFIFEIKPDLAIFQF